MVLVFHDARQRRRQEAWKGLFESRARLDLAVRGSNCWPCEVDVLDGLVENGRVNPTNAWESLGYDPGVEAPTSTSSGGSSPSLVHPGYSGAARGEGSSRRASIDEPVTVRRRRFGSARIGSARNTGIPGRAARWCATRRGRPVRFIGSRVDDHRPQTGRRTCCARASNGFGAFVDRAADAFFLADGRIREYSTSNRQACESLGVHSGRVAWDDPARLRPGCYCRRS